MFHTHTQDKSVNMPLLPKNQTFVNKFRPFSDLFSKKSLNLDKVRPNRTIIGSTELPFPLSKGWGFDKKHEINGSIGFLHKYRYFGAK